MNKRLVVVGLGGIGTWFLHAAGRYLNHLNSPDQWTVVLVDGDRYETGNAARQLGADVSENKASAQANAFLVQWPRLTIVAEPVYLGEMPAKAASIRGVTYMDARDLLLAGDVVALCVDNHKTRKHCLDAAKEMRDVTLFSAGNDYDDGNVNVYVRRDGEDLTPPFDKWHPEIAEPKDKSPHEMSCEELAAAGSPQLVFANMMAAALLAGAFYRHLSGKKPVAEVYFDVGEIAAVPRERH